MKLFDYKLKGTDGVHTEEDVVYNATERMKSMVEHKQWNPNIEVRLVKKEQIPAKDAKTITSEPDEEGNSGSYEIPAEPAKTNYHFEVHGDMNDVWKKEEARVKAIKDMFDEVKNESEGT